MNFYFKESLFNIPDSSSESLADEKLNENESVIFLIAENDHQVELIDFLQKIASSIDISFNKETMLLVLNKSKQYSVHDFVSRTKHRKLISFSFHEENFKTQFNKMAYKWLYFENIDILFADSLHNIHADVGLKKNLWQALKQIKQ